MAIDLGLAAALLAFGLLGAASGAIRQLTHWAGLACGALAAGPLAARLTPLVAPRVHFPAAGVRVALSSILFGLLAGLGALVVHAALSKLSGGREDGKWNRAGGFGLGVAKGGAVLFVLLSVLIFFEKPLIAHFGKPPAAVDESRAVALVRAHGLFETVHFAAANKLERLLEAARDPNKAQAMASDPEVRRFLDDPALKSALQDPALAAALRSGDLSALKNDPKLGALLNDPRFSEKP
jgi:membrane protein required for colicin V production